MENKFKILHHLPVISGSARGRTLGIPTLNIDTAHIPRDLPEGVYAGRVTIDHTQYAAVMHYGSRPVFRDTLSFEIHLLDTLLEVAPTECDVSLVAFLRPTQSFSSSEELLLAINRDIDVTRAILASQ